MSEAEQISLNKFNALLLLRSLGEDDPRADQLGLGALEDVGLRQKVLELGVEQAILHRSRVRAVAGLRGVLMQSLRVRK